MVGGGLTKLGGDRRQEGPEEGQELNQREPTTLYYYELHGNQILKDRHGSLTKYLGT